MEPLSALGVASNVVQFVDFASKVVSETARIYRGRARRDAEDERSELERVTNDLWRWFWKSPPHAFSCLHKQVPFASILVSILSNYFATVDIGLYKDLCSS